MACCSWTGMGLGLEAELEHCALVSHSHRSPCRHLALSNIPLLYQALSCSTHKDTVHNMPLSLPNAVCPNAQDIVSLNLTPLCASRLQCLDIAGNPLLGDVGLEALARGLAANATLAELRLQGCGLSARGTAALAAAMAVGARALRRLDLSDNEGAHAASGMTHLRCYQHASYAWFSVLWKCVVCNPVCMHDVQPKPRSRGQQGATVAETVDYLGKNS